MQTDGGEYQRHQLADALGQCGQQLRNTALMLDHYASFLQNMPQTTLSPPVQNMFQMFAPPQSGAGPTPAAPNGVPAPIPAPAAKNGRKRRVSDSAGDNAGLEVDENGKKKRKRLAPGEKKVKDANAPKRPPSAYLLFQNEVRKEMKERYPDLVYREVLTKISERWSQMTDAEKKYYNDVTNESRAQFEVNKAAYDASLAVQNGAPSAASTAATPAAPAPAPVAAPTVPSVPIVPPSAAPVAPASAPAPAASDDEEEEEEASEASSRAAVSAAVAQSSESSSESSSDSESTQESSSDNEDAVPAPKLAAKKSAKPTSKKEKAAPASVKPAASAKAENESKKKDKKSKKDAIA